MSKFIIEHVGIVEPVKIAIPQTQSGKKPGELIEKNIVKPGIWTIDILSDEALFGGGRFLKIHDGSFLREYEKVNGSFVLKNSQLIPLWNLEKKQKFTTSDELISCWYQLSPPPFKEGPRLAGLLSN